jgi:hypothetical protein
MKCPRCQHSQKYSAGMICQGCHYSYIFNPKKDEITDGKFKAVLDAATNSGSRYVTPGQVYLVFCKKIRPLLNVTVFILVGALFFLFHFCKSFESVIISLGFIVCGVFLLHCTIDNFWIKHRSFDDFKILLKRWESRYGKDEKLLVQPRLQEPPPDWPEADIYDYGVSKILIVQQDIYVDYLVLNGFHADASVVIISESGYPHYIFKRVQQLLRENSDLCVYILHDSTTEGQSMRKRIKYSEPFNIREHTIIDLGFSPENVKSLKGFSATLPKKNNFEMPLD